MIKSWVFFVCFLSRRCKRDRCENTEKIRGKEKGHKLCINNKIEGKAIC